MKIGKPLAGNPELSTAQLQEPLAVEWPQHARGSFSAETEVVMADGAAKPIYGPQPGFATPWSANRERRSLFGRSHD